MDYQRTDGQVKSIHERRSYPNQPAEELKLLIGENGTITLETSVEELRIPE